MQIYVYVSSEKFSTQIVNAHDRQNERLHLSLVVCHTFLITIASGNIVLYTHTHDFDSSSVTFTFVKFYNGYFRRRCSPVS